MSLPVLVAAIPATHRIERTPSEFSPRFVTLRDCKNPGHSAPPPVPDDAMNGAHDDDVGLSSAVRHSGQSDAIRSGLKVISTATMKAAATFEVVASPPPLPQRDD